MQAENISVILENSAGPCYLRIFFGFWNILVNLFSWWKIRKLSLLMWLLHRFPKVYLSHSLPHIRFSPPFFHCMAVRSGQYCSNHWEHLLLPFSPSGLKFFLHIGEKKKNPKTWKLHWRKPSQTPSPTVNHETLWKLMIIFICVDLRWK